MESAVDPQLETLVGAWSTAGRLEKVCLVPWDAVPPRTWRWEDLSPSVLFAVQLGGDEGGLHR
jgi:hypothetical protein